MSLSVLICKMETVVSPLMHLTNISEHLLCAGSCPRGWGHSSEQDRSSGAQGVYHLVEGDKEINK